MNYDAWFRRLTGHPTPHRWQSDLATAPACADRLIRVSTGLGKTEGVLSSWVWNRIMRGDDTWPRRLIWCLPMRVLVEQTARVAAEFLQAAAVDADTDQSACQVHRLLGGVELDEWHLHPERPAVLVGTQDMLLSRALNRGYAAGRARWPMEYGLLNTDCLWVMDEVQLMDVGLATSVQLQAFRRALSDSALRPCHTWWMSATLQPGWLETVDSQSWLPDLTERMVRIAPAARKGPAWAARKPLVVQRLPAKQDAKAENLAAAILDAHRAAEPDGTGRVTLAIVNRVDTASAVHAALRKALGNEPGASDLRLVHSRFRGLERLRWPEEFLSREACEAPTTDRIIVATQIVEAGVDISATALITELAPWPNLVQRFGRAARYGGVAELRVIDRDVEGKSALPYEEADLAAALEALQRLSDGGLESLESLEEDLEVSSPDLLARLYPYEPLHVLTRRENDELFDTSPDLTGADLDISRFIRTGDERDLSIWWLPIGDVTDSAPDPGVQPLRDDLCPVPVGQAKKWLFDGAQLKNGCRAWSWDYVSGQWRRLRIDDCYPGQVLLVDAGWGGYDVALGFTGASGRQRDKPVPTRDLLADATEDEGDGQADLAQPRDDLSIQNVWKTIAIHGEECAEIVGEIAAELHLDPLLAKLLHLAGRVHDLGKAHPVFQASILDSSAEVRPERRDLAKAPTDAWVALQNLYREQDHGHRRGFRHELASTLALFEVLRHAAPDHAALLGPHQDLVELGILRAEGHRLEDSMTSRLGEELAALSAPQFDLLCHLVSTHHGKVRGAWQGTPHDQKFPQFDDRFVGEKQPLNGVREGDVLPATLLAGSNGEYVTTPRLTLHLDAAAMGLSPRYGASWSERLHRLLARHGPFALGYLEALLRAADIRSSRMDTADPHLIREGVPA